MNPITLSLRARPRLAALVALAVALLVAACKGGGSSGY
jgi:hypothetical protein